MPRVARSVEEVRKWMPKNAAVTLGVFDGVHVGHKRIIDDLVALKHTGANQGCYLITFDPHPLVVTHSKMTPPMLTTLEERIRLLSEFDLDGVLVVEFNEELANTDYRAFVRKYLLQTFNMTQLVLGYDCYFGKNREGSPQRVKEESSRMGFECKVVGAVENGGEAVSSTKIRNALIEGDVASANRLLGHSYLVKGEVVKGYGKGRDFGFPTANLNVTDPYKLWPPTGVYAIEVDMDGTELRGMMNVGSAPTVKSLPDGAREIEVHIFDFDQDIYGRELWVYCHTFLRKEQKFPSVEALIAQLGADKRLALESLERTPQNGR